MITKAEKRLALAGIMHLLSRGRHPLRPWLVLPVKEANLFLQNPGHYQAFQSRKHWVNEAITIAKLICQVSEVLDNDVCPYVRKLP